MLIKIVPIRNPGEDIENISRYARRDAVLIKIYTTVRLAYCFELLFWKLHFENYNYFASGIHRSFISLYEKNRIRSCVKLSYFSYFDCNTFSP